MARNRRLLARAAIWVPLLLAGCATPAPVRYIPIAEPFCAAVQTTCISKDDVLTEGTAQSIEANNRGRDALVRAKACKRKPTDTCKQEKPAS